MKFEIGARADEVGLDHHAWSCSSPPAFVTVSETWYERAGDDERGGFSSLVRDRDRRRSPTPSMVGVPVEASVKVTVRGAGPTGGESS